MDTTKFYFGNISQKGDIPLGHFTTNTDRSFRDLLLEYIKSKEPVHQEGDLEWRFGKNRELDGIVVGKFGKVFDEEPTKYDSEIGDFIQSSGEDADVSYFAIFFETNTIAFNRRLRIGPDQFTKAFAKGYNDYFPNEIPIDIEITEWEENLEHVLSTADKVDKIDFDLETTNPGPNEEMREMDNQFREAGADEFEIILNADQALNVGADVIQSGVSFVKNKYGDARVKFTRNGREEEYSTKSKTATKTLEEPDGIDDVIGYIDELRDQLSALMADDD